MTQTRTITVEQVEHRTTGDGKRYWRVRVAGETRSLFVWDPEVANALVAGQTYRVTVNGSAEYPRITDVVPADEPAAEPPAPAAREQQLLRLAALRAAAEVMHGSQVPAAVLLDYAETVLAWLEGR